MRTKRKNRLLAWILLLAMVVADLPVLPGGSNVEVQAADTTSLPKNDQFDDADPKDTWKIYNEDNTHWTKTGGYLQIKTQRWDWWQYNEHRPGSQTPHNIFYQPASGDWESITKVKFEALKKDFQAVGVMVADSNSKGEIDSDNYIWFRYEHITDNDKYEEGDSRRNGFDSGDDDLAVRVNKEIARKNSDAGQDINFTTDDGEIFYKVTKIDNDYAFAISDDGKSYKEICMVEADFEHPVFALAAFNSEDEDASIKAEYDSVTFTEPNMDNYFPIEPAYGNGKNRLYTVGSGYNYFESYVQDGRIIETNRADATEEGQIVGIHRTKTSGNAYVSYKINVKQAGTYSITPYLAKGNADSSAKFGMTIDGRLDSNGQYQLESSANTGGWCSYKAFGGNEGEYKIYLSQGVHTIKFKWSGKRTDFGYVDFDLEYKNFKIEAESGSIAGEATINSGSCSNGNVMKNVGGFGNGRSTYCVHSNVAGNRNIKIYGKSTKNRYIKITVNGESSTVYFPSAEKPDTTIGEGNVKEISIKLNKGENTIIFSGDYPDYAPNFDCFTLDLTAEEAEATVGCLIKDMTPYVLINNSFEIAEEITEKTAKSSAITQYKTALDTLYGEYQDVQLDEATEEKWDTIQKVLSDDKSAIEKVYQILEADMKNKESNGSVYDNWSDVETAYEVCKTNMTKDNLRDFEAALNNLRSGELLKDTKEKYEKLQPIIDQLLMDNDFSKYPEPGNTSPFHRMKEAYKDANSDKYKAAVLYELTKPDSDGKIPITANDLEALAHILDYLDSVTKDVLDIRFEKLEAIKNAPDLAGYTTPELTSAYRNAESAYKNDALGAVGMDGSVDAFEAEIRNVLKKRAEDFLQTVDEALEHKGYYVSVDELKAANDKVENLNFDTANVFELDNAINALEKEYNALVKKVFTITINPANNTTTSEWTVGAGTTITIEKLSKYVEGGKGDLEFAGWYVGDIPYIEANSSEEKVVEGSLNLTAKWHATVTFKDGDTVYDEYTQQILEGNKVTRPADDPKKDGYSFRGWRLADDGSDEIYAFGDPVIKDVTLEAVWKNNDFDAAKKEFENFKNVENDYIDNEIYTLASRELVKTAYSNAENACGSEDNSADSAAELYSAIRQLELAIRELIKVEDVNDLREKYQTLVESSNSQNIRLYTLESWNTMESAKDAAAEVFGIVDDAWTEYVNQVTHDGSDKVKSYDELNSLVTAFDSAIGGLTKKNITITFKSNGEVTSDFPASKVIKAGDVVGNDANVKLERDGYIFCGWYARGAVEAFAFDEPVYDSTELIAKWNVKVTFNANGGKIENGNYEIEVEESSTLDQKTIEVTKTNRELKGWYINGEDDEDAYDFNTPVTEALDLIAIWNIKVTFYSNGGSAVAPELVEEGTVLERPAVPTKDGYAFMGWYLNGEKYDFNEPVNEIITLKAGWLADDLNASLDQIQIPGCNQTTGEYTRDESYTNASLDKLEARYTDLEAAIISDNTSEEELKTIIADLQTLTDQLVTDKDAKDLISNFNKQREIYSKYSEETKQALKAVFDSANNAISDYAKDATGYENIASKDSLVKMQQLLGELESAISSLLEQDKDKFDELKETEKLPDISDEETAKLYTSVSWEPYKEAYQEVEEAYENNDASALNSGLAALLKAKDELVLIKDVEDLITKYNNLVTEITGNQELYTEAGLPGVQAALDSAKTAFDGLTVENKEAIDNVDKARETGLNEAYDNLFTTAKNAMKKYTVQFDSAGGSAVPDQIVIIGENATKPTTTRAGYTLKGWYMGSEAYDFNAAVKADLKLTAKWTFASLQAATDKFKEFENLNKDDYTEDSWVAFEEAYKAVEEELAKGDAADLDKLADLMTRLEDAFKALVNKGYYTVTFMSDEVVYGTVQQVQPNGKATMPTPEPTKEGYTFKGWYIDPTTEVVYDFNTPVTANLVLKAKWEAEATTTPLQTAKDAFKQAEDKWNGLQGSKGDYTETSWKEAEDAYRAAAGEAGKENPNADTLKGLVEALNKEIGDLVKNTYTVTFMSEGKPYGAVQPVTVKEKAKVPTPAPTKPGYIFKGWYIDPTTEAVYDFNTPVTANLVLTAKWEAEAITTPLQTAQEAFKKAEDTWNGLQGSKGDYTETSWKEAEDAYKAAKEEAEKENPNADTLKGLVEALNREIGDLVKNTYTVTFMSDNKQYGEVQPVTVKEKAKEPTPAPTKPGYIFKGWYIDPTTEAVYDFNTPVTANLVLTAKWEAEATTTPLQAAKDAFKQAEDTWNGMKDSRDEYTEESWKEAEDAYKAAKEEAEKENPNPETLQGLVDTLNKEIGDLEKKGFTVTFMVVGKQHGDVQTVASGGKATEPEKPEKEHFTFKAWYKKDAEEAYNFDSVVTEDIVLEAKWKFSSLELAKDEFKKYEEKYSDMDEVDYTEESWKAFEDAYNAVKEEIDKGEDADLEKLADLMCKLEEAYNGLEKRDDKEIFKALEDKYNSLNKEDYTEESWKALEEAYNKLKEEMDKGDDADPEKIKMFLEDFKAAFANLKPLSELKVESIKITGISKQIAAGKKVKLTANISPEKAPNKSVIWSTSNKKFATVNAKGVVKTKKAGKNKKVTITATATDGSGVKATYKIKIMPMAVKKVKVTAAANTVKAGKSLKLKGTVTPQASKKKLNAKLQWTSSNTKYATVNAKGVVKTKKAGKNKTVKITAMSTDGTNRKAVFKIKIKK